VAALAHQRCFNHAGREAAARCPECERFFCRECVTEHDNRVLCSKCLSKLIGDNDARGFGLGSIWRSVQFIAGLLLIWFVFFSVGQALLKIPSAFHETLVWRGDWFPDE